MYENNIYNGYTNYSTWLVRLHFDSDEYTQEQFKEVTLQAYEESNQDREETITCIRNYINYELSEMLDENTNDLVKNLFEEALTRVNTWEIAKRYYDDFIVE